MTPVDAVFSFGLIVGLMLGFLIGYVLASRAWSRRLERLHAQLLELNDDDVGLVEWPGPAVPGARR